MIIIELVFNIDKFKGKKFWDSFHKHSKVKWHSNEEYDNLFFYQLYLNFYIAILVCIDHSSIFFIAYGFYKNRRLENALM